MQTVILAFSEKALRQLCLSESKARRVLGEQVAQRLKRRLADLSAAESVMDLVAGQPCELDNAQMSLALCDGYHIFFCANSKVPFLESGAVDWSHVRRIKILRIEKGHYAPRQ